MNPKYFWPRQILAGFLVASGFPFKNGWSFPLGPIIGNLFIMLSFYEYFALKIHCSRKMLLGTLAAILAGNTLGFYWIPNAIESFANIHPPLSWLAGIIYSLFGVPHVWIFSFCFFLLRRKNADKYVKHSAFALGLASIFTCIEYYSPATFPAHLGHSWLPFAPYLGLAPIFGVGLYTFLSHWITFELLSGFLWKKYNRASFFMIGLILLLNIIFPLSYSLQSVDSVRLRLVQSNFENDSGIFRKKDQRKKEAFDTLMASYKTLSNTPTSAPLDLIIWPETAYPKTLNFKDPESLPAIIKTISEEQNVSVLFGGYDRNPSYSGIKGYENIYVSAFLTDIKGNWNKVYHKRKLLLLGETLPFGSFNKKIKKIIPKITFMARGQERPVFDLKDRFHFITPICYEILFPEDIRSYLNSVDKHVDFFVNMTNDVWYGKSSEPFQHELLAKWRSLEFQKPLVRTTNTGVSAIHFPDGRTSKRLLPDTKGVLDYNLPLENRKTTIYQTLGFGSLFILFIICFFIQWICIRAKKTKHEGA